jgi:phosphatidate cytidylyltransferase
VLPFFIGKWTRKTAKIPYFCCKNALCLASSYPQLHIERQRQLFLVGQSSFWIQTVKEYGLVWVLFPAFLVVVNDTMAYVFGVLLGKHKLLPRLSPKKTVEGFIGAGISTLAVAAPLLKFMMGKDGVTNAGRHALTLALYVSLVSPFGGFLASAVKRAHGAKDFGALIPGHGGVVDRFDCQIVTAPFVYLYLKNFLSE